METQYCNVPAIDKGHIPVQISLSNTILKLRRGDTGNPVGALVSEGLCRLMREYHVTLTGRLRALTSKQSKELLTSQKGSGTKWGARNIRIILYGLSRDKDAISKLLLDHELFLQNPAVHEYDSNVTYWNPQYLVRPGTGMPSLDNDFTEAGDRGGTGDLPQELMEEQVHAIMRIFDLDSNVEVIDVDEEQVAQSSRLLTTLKRYPHSGNIWDDIERANAIKGIKCRRSE